MGILQSDLATPSAARSIADLKKDIVAHMLIPHYQGAIKAAYDMDEGDAAAKAGALSDGAEHWKVIRAAVGSFAASDRAQLTAMFAPAASGKMNFCTVQALLLRNLPGASNLQYGGLQGDTRTAKEDDVQHVTKKDVGVLKASLQTDGGEKDCSTKGTLAMPPPAPPPKTLKTASSEANVDSDSGLSEGEIAGVAIGAAVGGIVLLGAVGLILRSIMFKEAKPVFTCLEKAPAKSPA